MTVQKLEERPPFVAFETTSVEDREASIEQGHYVGRDVDMAYITPAGSKDRIERVVADWFPQLDADLQNGRIPPTWAEHYKAAYSAYKKGQAVPTNGIPIKDWPGLSPTQVKNLTSLHLLSIEDVAAANEETIARMGMGGRALKQRAVDYLNASQNVGKVAEEASALRSELATEKSRNDQLAAQVAALSAQVQLINGGGGGGNFGGSASSGISASDILGDDPGQKL